MKNSQTIIIFCSVLFASILIFSCGASHDIIEQPVFKDRDFSYNELKNNSVIVGGITSQQLFISESDRIRYGSLLSTSLIENLKDVHTINLLNTRQFVERLGYKNYFDIMKESDIEQELHKDAIDFIKEDFSDFKYLIIANIENENIIDRSESELIRDDEGKEKLETDYEKTYFLTVEFQIYDIIKRNMVYKTLIFNRAFSSETRTTETGCVESCISGAISDILWGSPAEIDREEVLVEIFKNFSTNLSKQ